MKPTQSQIGSTALDRSARRPFPLSVPPSPNEAPEPTADTIEGAGIPAHRLYYTAMSLFLTGLSEQARAAAAVGNPPERGDVVAG